MIDKKSHVKSEQGERLKKSREYLRLTQGQFGDKIGLKWSQIKDRESGLVQISLSIAKNIEAEHGIRADWILSGEGSMIAEESLLGYLAESSSHYGYASSFSSSSSPYDKNLLSKTRAILESDSPYRRALDSNIVAFHEAVKTREELDRCKAQLYELKDIVEKLRTEVAELKATRIPTKRVV